MPFQLQFANSHRARMEDCISLKPMEQNPIAFWRHFPVDDQDPESFAAALINFQDTFDFDFIKVTPASSFCLRDWGTKDLWKGSTEGTREITHYVIQNPDDWEKLKVLDPNNGSLFNQWKCLQAITEKYNHATPVIQTVFSPLAQAKNLVGKDKLLIHLHQHPQQLLKGLETITESTLLFIEKCCEMKIDGVFFAVQHAQKSLLTPGEFDQFCSPFDMRILQSAENLWLNMVHIHGEDIYFEKVSNYPAAILNWHDRHTYPALSQARKLFNGVLCGGISQWESMAWGEPEKVRGEAIEALNATQRTGFILGTGCVLPIITPFGNILAARKSVI